MKILIPLLLLSKSTLTLKLSKDSELAILEQSCQGNKLCENLVNEFKQFDNSTEIGLRTNRVLNPELRKLKQLKVLILWLQPEYRFARYCFYGCYCLPEAGHRLYTKGYGKPVDEIDNSCKRQTTCYECAQMDHPDKKCDSKKDYNYVLEFDENDPNNHWKKSITCTDEGTPGSKSSCRRAICECDKRMAEDLREFFDTWNVDHHAEQGSFNPDVGCTMPDKCLGGNCENGRDSGPLGCCGSAGNRFPYKTFGGTRSCCGERTFDNTFQTCCDGDKVSAIGSCLE